MKNFNVWHDVPLGDNAPEEINAIIEIASGSKNKYEIDKETGLVALDRVNAQEYPFDYGLIPQTYWEDDDPLDAVIIATYPFMPGALIPVRPLAIMHMIDGGEGDDKIICVPAGDKHFAHLSDLDDLNPRQLKEIEHFFKTYKQIDEKEVEVTGFEDKAAAHAAINKGIELYNKKFGS